MSEYLMLPHGSVYLSCISLAAISSTFHKCSHWRNFRRWLRGCNPPPHANQLDSICANDVNRKWSLRRNDLQLLERGERNAITNEMKKFSCFLSPPSNKKSVQKEKAFSHPLSSRPPSAFCYKDLLRFYDVFSLSAGWNLCWKSSFLFV